MGLMLDRFLPRDNVPTTLFVGQSPMIRGDRNIGPLIWTPGSGTRYAWFPSVLSRAYNGGGMTFQMRAHCDAAGDVTWGAAWERHVVSTTDLSLLTNFGSEITGTMASPSGGFQRAVTIAITHADLGSPQVGETYRLRIKCVANASPVLLMSCVVFNTT